MNLDNELQKHYAQLLGIGTPWEVQEVTLKLTEKQVEIELGWQWGGGGPVSGLRPGLCVATSARRPGLQ